MKKNPCGYPERLVITKKQPPKCQYNMGYPRIRLDVDVYEEIVDIADSTQRSVKEVACTLIRFALDRTDVQA